MTTPPKKLNDNQTGIKGMKGIKTDERLVVGVLFPLIGSIPCIPVEGLVA
jgi:hypothetical protein